MSTHIHSYVQGQILEYLQGFGPWQDLCLEVTFRDPRGERPRPIDIVGTKKDGLKGTPFIHVIEVKSSRKPRPPRTRALRQGVRRQLYPAWKHFKMTTDPPVEVIPSLAVPFALIEIPVFALLIWAFLIVEPSLSISIPFQ